MSFLKISMKRQSKVALRNTCVAHSTDYLYLALININNEMCN